MFGYFDSLSDLMKIIRQLGKAIPHSNLVNEVLVMKAKILLVIIVHEPFRLYLYVPP